MSHTLDILRRKSTDYGTPGRATLDNGWWCDTLELPWFGNQKGASCIKADSYAGRLWYSPTMKRWVIRLEDKHGRADCLLHNGNFAGDASKGLCTQVHGCTLIGKGYGAVQLPGHGAGYESLEGQPGMQYGIMASRVTLDELIRQLGGDPTLPADGEQPDGTDVLVTYRWEDGAQPDDDV